MENQEIIEQIRILVAEDADLFRDALCAVILSTPDMKLVGEAKTGEEVVQHAGNLQPDVILMDIQMPPGMNGIEATRIIHHASPHIGILVVTSYDEDENVFRAMRAGARGYLLKDANRTEIRRAIRQVNNGLAIFSPTIATRLIDFFSSFQLKAPSTIFPELTEREREILVLIAQNYRTSEIASRLSLEKKTVYNYLSNIFSKLQVADRAEAILRAKEAGLV